MRRWSGQPANPAFFDIGRIRQIGEWGHASRYVGARWEELGLEQLRASLEATPPAAILPVCVDADLGSLLAATGSKNPDVVLARAEDGRLVLQAADLKWSLDVASYQQISGETLQTLVAAVPRLSELILDQMPEELRQREISTRDGYFFAPRTSLNERFLTSPENRKQEYPLEASEIVFASVDPYEFFEPLPGWLTARELARLDGSARGLTQIDLADRYYHFGAGTAGALAALEGSIFDDELVVEPEREVERFRAFLKTLNPPSTATTLDRLGSRMRQRHELIRRLRDLTRGAYTFRDFAESLVQAGLATAEQSERELRARWSDLYRSLIDAQEAELRHAGRELRARGLTDAQALESLERERESFARHLRSRGAAAIRAQHDSA